MGELRAPRIEALRSDITEGGDGEHNRFTEFSKVAGGFIAQARRGEITLETAYAMTLGWMQLKMMPPWPEQRAESEFNALARLDQANHPANGTANGAALPFPVEGPPTPATVPLEGFLASSIAYKPVPVMRWTVEGMIPEREASGLISDGSVGKSYLLLQLGLALTGGFGPTPPLWCGRKVIPVEGLVVVISAEDGKEELERRLHAIATDDQINLSRDRLLLYPMPDLGGAQPIVSTRKRRIDNDLIDVADATPFWEELLAKIKARGLPVSFVGLDTFSSLSHDDENKVKTIREFMSQAMRVCRDLMATLLLTHHLRKHEDGFKDSDEALQAVRGSTGLPNALRAVSIIYTPKDWRARMRALGVPPVSKQLYGCGTPKLNRPGIDGGDVTLLRNKATGLLEGIEIPNDTRKHLAAMALSIRLLVLAGAPLCRTGKSAGVFACKMRLHPCLRDLPRWRLELLCEDLERERRVVTCRISNQRTVNGAYYDVVGGPLAAGQFTPEDLRGGAIKVDYAPYQWHEAREEWVTYGFSVGPEAAPPEDEGPGDGPGDEPPDYVTPEAP